MDIRYDYDVAMEGLVPGCDSEPTAALCGCPADSLDSIMLPLPIPSGFHAHILFRLDGALSVCSRLAFVTYTNQPICK